MLYWAPRNNVETILTSYKTRGILPKLTVLRDCILYYIVYIQTAVFRDTYSR